MAIPWFEIARRYWHFAAIGLLIIACTWLRHDNARLAKQRDSEQAAHALTIDRYRQAQDVAARLATEAKQKKEATNETARQVADADLDDLRARYRAAVGKLRRQAPPAGRAPGQPDLPGSSETAQSTDGPGAGASVLVSNDDALICADNTARLQVARDWVMKVSQP